MTKTWKQGYQDADLHLLLDEQGEMAGSVIYDPEGFWWALDANGELAGSAPGLEEAKSRVDALYK